MLCASSLLVSCAGGIPKESSRPPKGNPQGVILIEEYAEFQCPYCAPVHFHIVGPLLEQYGNAVRYEWKHFPLRTIHQYAQDASEASECAADQGKFWEYVDLVFGEQERLGYDALIDWAKRLRLDIDLFERCWKSHAKRETVLDDYREGREREVFGTPTFFVNGRKVQTGFDTLSAAIEEEIKRFEQRL